MFKTITEVRPGDIISEPGGGRTEVKTVEFSPGSCKGKIYINDKDCYEGFAEVRVQD